MSLTLRAQQAGAWSLADLVATVPSGYRPAATIYANCVGSTGAADSIIQINSSGAITVNDITNSPSGRIDIQVVFATT